MPNLRSPEIHAFSSSGAVGCKNVRERRPDGCGIASYTFKPAKKVGKGKNITATATSSAGNTSEFSAPRTVRSS